MTYVVAYVAVLIVFSTIDAVWLTTMGAILYRLFEENQMVRVGSQPACDASFRLI